MLGLESLLTVAPYHDNGKEAADDGATKDDEDDGDANGPYSWKEERMKEVVFVDKGHEKSPDGVVDEDDSCSDKHAESHGAVEHLEDWIRVQNFS